MVAPELQKVAARQAGKYLVVKVNTDVLGDLGERFGIRSIPTMAVFAGGREVAPDERVRGPRATSKRSSNRRHRSSKLRSTKKCKGQGRLSLASLRVTLW